VIKYPSPKDPDEFRCNESLGGKVAPYEPSLEELAVAARVLTCCEALGWPVRLSRIDLIPSARGPLLMEAELLNPSVYANDVGRGRAFGEALANCFLALLWPDPIRDGLTQTVRHLAAKPAHERGPCVCHATPALILRKRRTATIELVDIPANEIHRSHFEPCLAPHGPRDFQIGIELPRVARPRASRDPIARPARRVTEVVVLDTLGARRFWIPWRRPLGEDAAIDTTITDKPEPLVRALYARLNVPIIERAAAPANDEVARGESTRGVLACDQRNRRHPRIPDSGSHAVDTRIPRARSYPRYAAANRRSGLNPRLR